MLVTRYARPALLTPLTVLSTSARLASRPTKFRRLATMSEPAPAVAAPPVDAAEGVEGGPSKGELKKRAKEAEKERKRLEREQREAEQKAAKEAADVVRRFVLSVFACADLLDGSALSRRSRAELTRSQDYATQNYGMLPLNQSQEKTGALGATRASLIAQGENGRRSAPSPAVSSQASVSCCGHACTTPERKVRQLVLRLCDRQP